MTPPTWVRRLLALAAVLAVTALARRLDGAGPLGHLFWLAWSALLSALPAWLGVGKRPTPTPPAPTDDDTPTDELPDVIPFRQDHNGE